MVLGEILTEAILEVDAKDWEAQVLKSDVPVIVDFWHEKCPWCLKLNPIFDEVAREYKGKIKFVKVNVMKNQENRKLAISYGIMSTPTLMLFHKGKPAGQIIGFIPKEKMKKVLDDMLKRIGNPAHLGNRGEK